MGWAICVFGEVLDKVWEVWKVKVTINADDFGKDENASLAIVESFRRGFITQTTLMVNMPWADKAVELARKEGFSEKVGLHLNLTEGKPLTAAMSSCDVFCDASGLYKGRLPSAKELKAKSAAKALEQEIVAQVERFLSFGLSFLHCDGHNHVQARHRVAKVLMPVLRHYGFRSIRRPINAYANPFLPHLRSRLEEFVFKTYAKRNSLDVSSSVFGGWSAPTERIACSRRPGCLEVMVHPRYDADGRLVDVTDFRNNTGRVLEGLGRLIGVQ